MTNKKANYTYGVARYKGRSYFSMATFNGLFMMDDDLMPFIIHRFVNHKFLERNLYSDVVAYDDKLYLIPLTAGNIVVYDLNNNNYYEIESCFESKDFGVYAQAMQIEERVLLIPFDIKTPFALLDMQEEKVVNLNDINDNLAILFEEYYVTQRFTMFAATKFQDDIYLSVSNLILVINVNSRQVNYYKIPEKIVLKNSSIIGEDLFITCEDYRLVKWNIRDKVATIIEVPITVNNTKYPFRNLIPISEGYLLLPAQENVVLKANHELTEWSIIELPNQFYRVYSDNSLFLAYSIEDTYVILYPHGGNGFVVYDMITGCTSYKDVCIEDAVLTENNNELLFLNEYIEEGTVVIDEFLSAITHLDN